ncbi:MAG: DsbA family protein [Bradymonadia bacterium]
MKKEVVILGFVVIAAAAFGISRMTASDDAPETNKKQVADTAKPADKANADKGGAKAPAAGNAAKAVAKGGDAGNKIPVGTSYGKGGNAEEALVTIVEFSDFQCPFCSRVNPTLKQIDETYGKKVRVVFKHNPLPFHKDAPLASEAALAAGEQGKFWEMHDKLFQNQKALKRPELEKYASELGLDMDKFKSALDGGKFKKAVADDMALASKVGARGTPNFFVNGVQITGARPFPSFKEVIDAELKKAEEMAKAGKTPAEIYTAMVNKNWKAPAPRKANPKADDKSIYKVPVGASYAKGPADAQVTIVEFSEFQCPFCSRVNPTMAKIQQEYGDKVRIVFKHNPLPFHKDAFPAALASEAAGKQGKFWEMHDKLFANQKALKADNLNAYATELGLDMGKFKADMADKTLEAKVKADMALAQQIGARGTPNMFINGRKVVGAKPFPAFKTIIDEEVKKADKLIAAGTAKAQVYAKLTEKGLTKAAAPAPKKRAEDKTIYKVPVVADSCKGPADALVTIVEFSEFQCPFCNKVLPTLKQIESTYGKDVRVCFKHNPLPFHKDAPLASQAAIAAGKQGKFSEMHDKLFANQRALKADNLQAYAKEIGLDMAKFNADLNSDAVKNVIKQDQALATQIGARGTPNFFINGRKLVGAQPFASFKGVIDEQKKAAEALVAKGTARANVYAELTKNGATKAAAPAGRKAPEPDNKIYSVKVNPGDAIKGNKNAKITIVEFSDFQCPFCSRVNPTMDQIQKEYGDKVRIVFKHNPLAFHKDAPLASQAALAAGEQGKFWEMHDMLFANQRALKRPELEKYATELGLNMDKFKSALDSGKYKAQIDADMAQARELGARGTPTFFVNGKKVRGAQPFAAFKTVIDEALKK